MHLRRAAYVLAIAGALGWPLHSAMAQDAETEEKVLEVGKWYPTVEAGLTLTQSSYSDNWNGGDKGSIVWSLIGKATLENQLNEKMNWNNVLKLAYGQTHQQTVQTDGERTWDEPEKSTDLIDYETILRFTLGAFVDPFVSGRFESQFQDASDPQGRTLALNPLRFKESAGVAKPLISEENRKLLTRLGLSLRQNVRRQFVEDSPNTDTQSESTNDGGVEWVTDYESKILDERVTWASKLTVYQPLFYSAQDEFDAITTEALSDARLDKDLADFTSVADVDWENIFTTQITKIISVNLYTRLIYDKYDNSVAPAIGEDGAVLNPQDLRVATRKGGQFKQTLSIGLTYRFI